jgi:HKD family nuclease
MSRQVVVSGVNTRTLLGTLGETIRRTRPKCVGIASAFVSISGVDHAARLLRAVTTGECRLVAGIDHAVTHPEALYTARREGWDTRLGQASMGIFHPKLIVGCEQFAPNGTIVGLSFVYVGSSNLTDSGLRRNVECGVVAEGEVGITGAAEAFGRFWDDGQVADDSALRNYAAAFADRNRQRSPAELEALLVSDGEPLVGRQPTGRPPRRSAIATPYAAAAWAGLQSFTGEFRFQVEFPRAAGEVIHRLIGRRAGADGTLDVYCTSDGITRPMQYRFYRDNSMFRLNIPNEVPNVDWARTNRDGLALVEVGPRGGAALRLTIHLPGAEANDIISRSVALGTWGRTPTRLYGWF